MLIKKYQKPFKYVTISVSNRKPQYNDHQSIQSYIQIEINRLYLTDQLQELIAVV